MKPRSLNGSHDTPARESGLRATRPTLAPLPLLPSGARDLRELPVERYQRLRLAADCLRRMFTGRTTRVAASAADARDLAWLLAGEPFELCGLDTVEDCDAVVACDGLADVPESERTRALVDAARRVRSALIVVANFRAEGKGSASALVELVGEGGGTTLGAHEELELALGRAGLSVACLGHGDPARALALACASQQPSSGTLRRDVNELLYRAEPRAPFLRHAVIAWRGEVETRWMDELAPSFEPARELDGFDAHLALRLDALGSDPARAEAERRVAELEATLEHERAEAARAVALASDEFESLRRELAELRTAAIREVGEARNALEAERDARHALADRLAAREGFERAEAERHRAQLAAMEAEHRQQVEAARAETRSYDVLLSEARRETAQLRDALRGRWGNLRRALGPRSPGE